MRRSDPITSALVSTFFHRHVRGQVPPHDGESAGQDVDDARITTQMKAKLAADKTSHLTRVSGSRAAELLDMQAIGHWAFTSLGKSRSR